MRTGVLCLCAWPLCICVERWLRQVSDQWRPYAFGLLLGPFLFPELLVGYTYRGPALTSTRVAEGLCFGLLLFRIVPLGVVTLIASPPGLASASAFFCRCLLVYSSGFSAIEIGRLLQCLWHGTIRRVLPSLGLMGLVAFQEFELAALLQTASWTDWFIAAQRVGLNRNEMIGQSLWPVMMQLPLVLAIVNWTVQPHDSQVESSHEPVSFRLNDRLALVYLGLAFLGGCLIPGAFLASHLGGGLTLLLSQRAQMLGLFQEILFALSISLCAGLTTWSIANWFLQPPDGSHWLRIGRQVMLIPGLAGSLLLSLATVCLFQQPWLRPAYDTPIPWVMAVTIWLLPRAVLVRLWLEAIRPAEGLHLANLLANPCCVPDSAQTRPSQFARRSAASQLAGSLLFRLREQPRLLAIGILCYWAYLDLSTAYLLAPSGMPSGLVRLYNFMHFGRSAALSAEAFVFFGVPVSILGLTIAILRLLRRSRRP